MTTLLKKADPKTVQNLIGNRRLSGVMNKAQRLLEIDAVLSKILPAAAIPHCRVMNYDNHRLILATDSAAWATKLKYEKEAILTQLKTALPKIQMRSVQIKIYNDHVEAPIEKPVKQRVISEQSKQGIRQMAAGIKDENLRRALEKLGS